MAGTQHTQTHPKYQYRFMALHRTDMAAKPCRLTIEATSEQEARQRLSGCYILAFAGRVPAQGVCHV
ncbi:host cell division inhibitor Icd-like protein [Plesiomonas sp.]|uniref:host cell division inhibitor Icd-like protein n=1 Tax=Plesiomonas sp. TaxID=2486279 RepID=UPI003F377737